MRRPDPSINVFLVPIEPELRKLLRALVEGQVKLANGQRDTNAVVARLARQVSRLGGEVSRLGGEVSRLGKRLDRFAQAVVRGFTDGAARDKAFDARIDALERVVAVLGKPVR